MRSRASAEPCRRGAVQVEHDPAISLDRYAPIAFPQGECDIVVYGRDYKTSGEAVDSLVDDKGSVLRVRHPKDTPYHVGLQIRNASKLVTVFVNR
jgi:hypothetical protein